MMSWKGSTATATETGRRDREHVKLGAKQRLPHCGCKQRVHVPVLVLMLCFLALTGVDALDSAEELKMLYSNVEQRVRPCIKQGDDPYSTPKLAERCMEQERLVIDSQTSLYAFCFIDNMDKYRATDPSPCFGQGSQVCRTTEPRKDAWWNPVEGTPVVVQDAYSFARSRKRAIQECKFDDSVGSWRNEDFVGVVQEILYGRGLPGKCRIIADAICTAFGGNTTQYKEVTWSECCRLTKLPNSWTIESPELFEAWCGSGWRSGNEECDDGDLNFECDKKRFVCPPVASGTDPKVLRDKDGCNRFCQVETNLGWTCQAPPQDPEGSPVPDICKCNCDCKICSDNGGNEKDCCVCQDVKQRELCRVNSFGVQTDEFGAEIRCCGPLT